jgi:cation:H+ antiporter
LFLIAAVVIAVAGTFLARTADRLADRTGLGEALVGGFLLAGATSLPDFAATLSAAVDGRPQLAMSNVMGSMAANLMFLGIADIVYRKANLEHAAASTGNLTQAALLIALLAVVMVAAYMPVAQSWHVHPATILITLGYLYGVTLVHRTQASPMWFPRRTAETVVDVPDRNSDQIRMSSHWLRFTALSITTGAAGWVLMESAKVIADLTVLSDSIAGGLLTAVVTSTPELVTTIAAVRRGALTLALSNIVGTNGFNVLVIAMADVGYRQGSIYHDIAAAELTWGLTVILMTAVLLLGMVQRQIRGIGNIGFESVLMLSIYVVTLLALLA